MSASSNIDFALDGGAAHPDGDRLLLAAHAAAAPADAVADVRHGLEHVEGDAGV